MVQDVDISQDEILRLNKLVQEQSTQLRTAGDKAKDTVRDLQSALDVGVHKQHEAEEEAQNAKAALKQLQEETALAMSLSSEKEQAELKRLKKHLKTLNEENYVNQAPKPNPDESGTRDR